MIFWLLLFTVRKNQNMGKVNSKKIWRIMKNLMHKAVSVFTRAAVLEGKKFKNFLWVAEMENNVC